MCCHAWTLMQRTKLTMTSKALNLKPGLNRLVWKEGKNWNPYRFLCYCFFHPTAWKEVSIPLFGLQSIMYHDLWMVWTIFTHDWLSDVFRFRVHAILVARCETPSTLRPVQRPVVGKRRHTVVQRPKWV
jgi:hypothetical protein